MKPTMTILASALYCCLAGSASAQSSTCDTACLQEIAGQYLQDVAAQDASQLPWADRVRYTENNVAMMIGDGFWGAGPGVRHEQGLMVADASTGNVVWFGITTEHGQAAYHGLRLAIRNREIVDVESYLGREGTPDLFQSTADYLPHRTFSETLPRDGRLPRERMIALVDGWFNSKQLNDGNVFTNLGDDCVRITNGVNTTQGADWRASIAEGCRAQLEAGIYKPVDRIRARRYPVVNEETGVVVALSIEDHATRYVNYTSTDGQALSVEVEYPNSRGMLELFKISDGAIQRMEGISVFLPYYIHSLWQDQ
jgi:hypothetical protein